MHGHIAIIIVKAVIKHAPITADETSAQYLVHSIKQVILSNLIICFDDLFYTYNQFDFSWYKLNQMNKLFACGHGKYYIH